MKKKEKAEEGAKPRSGWEAASSYAERAVQVSYQRGAAHPRGARFTVLVQSAKQTDQLGDISKRSWNKAGEEGINSLRGGPFQLTHCQPQRIPSLPRRMPPTDFVLCTVACPGAPQPIPVHHDPSQRTTTHPSTPQPAPVHKNSSHGPQSGCHSPPLCIATPPRAPQPAYHHPSMCTAACAP